MAVSHYNPGPAGRRTMMEALIVVVSFNAILLVCFNYTTIPRAAVDNDMGEITLLNVENLPGFMTWIEYHDPALFVAPDRTYGYSAYGGLEAVHRTPESASATRPQRVRPAPEPVRAQPVSVPAELLDLTLSRTIAPPPPPVKPPEVRYPLIFRQGRPVSDWQIPEELLAAARQAGVRESRATFGTDLRCTQTLPGSDDPQWRKTFFLAMAKEATAASGGEAGEVTILWSAPES